jgi:phosphatidylglycerophosphate synthase
VALIGELLLYTAAGLTLWSMWTYLRSAWPAISNARFDTDEGQPGE